MDLATLNAFIAIAELGSFSEAAERLHLTQPAVSKRSKESRSLNHLVDAGEQRRGNFQAEDARGLRVDDQLELGGLLDR